MSEFIDVPAYLITKSGEPGSERMLEWIHKNQRRLLKAFPKGERAFSRVFHKWQSRMPSQWRTRFRYTRQKYFWVTQEIVFFGDFFFSNMKLLVEIDGASHDGAVAKEKDAWRERLITSWNTHTVRFTNDLLLTGDFREVEQQIVDGFCKVLPSSMNRRLLRDYDVAKRDHPHIYEVEGMFPTWHSS
jgi:very-short-patch-repair endonuclease